VNEKFPLSAGYPVKTPAPDKLNPVGIVPEACDQVYELPSPVAVKVRKYRIEVEPGERTTGVLKVIVGQTG
jgi:hypothetical protein